MARILFPLYLAMALLLGGVNAQFQFFEQMFQGGQQQRQEPQNVPSDSNWYQENYNNGQNDLPSPPSWIFLFYKEGKLMVF
jgi:hypothetical protein